MNTSSCVLQDSDSYGVINPGSVADNLAKNIGRSSDIFNPLIKTESGGMKQVRALCLPSTVDYRADIISSSMTYDLDTRYSILDTGYSILDTRYWILDTGYWYSVLDTRYSVLGTRYAILDTRYSILDTRYSILDTRYLPSFVRSFVHSFVTFRSCAIATFFAPYPL